jgi:hypothetical protein
MLCFFRSLIDFDWIEGHLISDRVESGQFEFLKKSGRVGFRSGRVGQVSRVGSGSATSKHLGIMTVFERPDFG